MTAGPLAGLDIGGTKLGWALGTPAGELLARGERRTRADARPEEQLEAVLDDLAGAARDHGRPRALGVACPGPFLQPEGRFLEVPNLPGWQGFALRAFLEERFDGPVEAHNDANAGVLAEWMWGAARGANTAVFLTMSTGMGAGLLLDGRLFEGPRGFAGEVGHLRLSPDGPVGFGKRGSVEGYLSGPGMVQVAEGERLRAVQRGEATRLAEVDAITPRTLCAAARDGDAAALAAIDVIGRKLGELCAVLVDLLEPEVIVLGTIGTAYPDLFVDRARAVLDAEAIPFSASRVRIVPSGLVDRGHLGALALAARRGSAGDTIGGPQEESK